MAFKASKVREKRTKPFAEGRQLVPSAAISQWYDGQLRMLLSQLLDDYRVELTQAFKTAPVKAYYAADASPVNEFVKRLNKLKAKWNTLISQKAKVLSDSLIKKSDEHSKTTIHASLTTLGIKEPRLRYTDNIRNTMQASFEFNNTLIKGLTDDAHEKVHAAVMASLSSPDPSKQGQTAILSVLNEVGIASKKRAQLIARDQTAKVYAALNLDRMEQNGITHFKWVHSSAGKVPRESHVAKNNEIFELNDPRLWTGPKADQGPPGHAINCRCRAVPVLDIGD